MPIPNYEMCRSAYAMGTADPLEEFIYRYQDPHRSSEWRRAFSDILDREREIARKEGHKDCLEIARRVEQNNEIQRRELRRLFVLNLFCVPKPPGATVSYVNIVRRYFERVFS